MANATSVAGSKVLHRLDLALPGTSSPEDRARFRKYARVFTWTRIGSEVRSGLVPGSLDLRIRDTLIRDTGESAAGL